MYWLLNNQFYILYVQEVLFGSTYSEYSMKVGQDFGLSVYLNGFELILKYP